MNPTNIILSILTFFFIMIGVDKFLFFLEPACSLMDNIPKVVWNGLGVLQIASGVLIWMPKYRKYLAGFWMIFMLVFTIVHLSQNTPDFGGALFMVVLLGVLVWNPSFIRSAQTH